MNAFAPQVAPQGRYDTKATCRELGISRSTLARYTKAGLIRPRHHKANMRPYFMGADITRLWTMSV